MKGFITIATGRDKYYIMAHNLLLSYRYHAKVRVPFAILCDRHNEWTNDFDQVVIIDNPLRSFMDKMRIFDLSPFDETIFIEADCLIYRDLYALWDIFKDSPDLGVLGDIFPLDSDDGWWKLENLGELKDKVDYKMDCQGGVLYVRNTGKGLPAFLETCRYIRSHYQDYRFRIFETVPQDETILTLASAVHHYRPVKRWVEVFAFYPETRFHHLDMCSGTLDYEWTRFPGTRYQNSFLIHFGTAHVLNGWIYNREAFKLRKKPLQFSDWVDFCMIWLRCKVNHSKPLKTISRLFSRQFRSKLALEKESL
jgi:hypothetical protein